MTNTRPHVALDGHYSMTETARLLGVNRATIYRWADIGYLKTKKYRHIKRQFIIGREILKVFDVFN